MNNPFKVGYLDMVAHLSITKDPNSTQKQIIRSEKVVNIYTLERAQYSKYEKETIKER